MNATRHHPLRLLAATLTVALAAGFAQTASAQPGPGMGPGRGPGPEMGMGMGHGMGHGMSHGPGMGAMGFGMAERALDAVNATPEQRTQIREIFRNAATDVRKQREGGAKLQQDLRALFTQPNVDAAAVEQLRQKMLAQHDQASKRMMQAMLDASQVLTPAQRKTLADKMGERRAMMERHRAERATLEGKPAR